MDHTLCTGTFKTVRSDDFVKFLTKICPTGTTTGTTTTGSIGTTKEEFEMLRGTTWRMNVSWIEGKKWVFMITCEEMPIFTHIDTLFEGTETECMWHPMLGGRCKVTLTGTGKDSCKVIVHTETFGTLEWTMKWTEDCMIRTTTGKRATITEKWCRKIKETGWFKMTKGDNLETFMIACGMPTEIAHTCCKEVMMGMEVVGDTCIMTTVWGDLHSTIRFRLDEETTCCVLGVPSLRRKLICTKTGNGNYTMVFMDKLGDKSEWDLQFLTTGMTFVGTHKKTGTTCKILLEHFTNMCGTFKPTTTTGFHRFGKALGLPMDMVTKMATEKDARLTICEKEGLIHSMYWSKFMPVNTVFKFNEEYDCTFCTTGMSGMMTGTMPTITGMMPKMTITTPTTGTTTTTTTDQWCPTTTTTAWPMTSSTCTWMTGMTCPLTTCKSTEKTMGMNGTMGTMGLMGMIGMTTGGTKLKVMTTRQGCTTTTITKGPRFTTKTTCKFTDNFITETCHILGTDIWTTTVMERVTCH